jgi:hypothetical protein
LPGVKNGAWGCGGACANAGTDISSRNTIATAIFPIRPSGTRLLFWYLKSFTFGFGSGCVVHLIKRTLHSRDGEGIFYGISGVFWEYFFAWRGNHH